MKKSVLVLVMVFLLLSLVGCGNASKQSVFCLNAYYGDLSWVAWYVQMNYGEKTLNNTAFYEIWDPETEMVIAQLPDDTEEGIGKYILFFYNRGLDDWYHYDHDVLKTEWTKYSTSKDGSWTARIIPEVYDEMSIYLTYKKSGKIQSIVYQWGLSPNDWCFGEVFSYEYDNKGRISSIRYFSSNELFADGIKCGLTDVDYDYRYSYSYSDSGYLQRIDEVYLRDNQAEPEPIYEFAYDHDKRLTTKEYPNTQYADTACFTYNDNGFVKSVRISESDRYNLRYNLDGSTDFFKIES